LPELRKDKRGNKEAIDRRQAYGQGSRPEKNERNGIRPGESKIITHNFLITFRNQPPRSIGEKYLQIGIAIEEEISVLEEITK